MSVVGRTDILDVLNATETGFNVANMLRYYKF